MPAGGSWHMVCAKAGDHASRAKAASGRSVAVIRSPCPGRQSFAAGKPRVEIAFEACRGHGAFNHDQIVILPLEPGCGKVRGAGTQEAPVDLVALEVHRGAGLVFDPNLDAGRFGEVIENFRSLALGELRAVEIDSHLDAAIGRACERLHDWPVRQHISGHVDFVLGAVDQGNVDVFKVLSRRVMNDWRGIGAAWRERGEEKAYRDATACYPQRYPINCCT